MLKVRTGYSFRSAVGSIGEAIEAFKAADATKAAIADTSSSYGFVRWKKACLAANLQPIYGVELAVSPDIHAKKVTTDYWSFFAVDDLEPLNQLVSTATSQFRYNPLITYEQAIDNPLIKVVGHRALLDRIESWAEDAELSRLWFGLSPAVSTGYFRSVQRTKFADRWVATSTNRYITEDQFGLYETICGRNANTQTYPQHFLSKDEWRREADRIGLTDEQAQDALENAERLFDDVTAELPKATLAKPERPDTLRNMCAEGAKRLGVDLSDETYADRLDRELGLIEDKGFEDYFYIMSDICSWARDRMLVGPARGSACGSLVCYLLRITTIDPIPHGLIFERFIDINRPDLPDVDVDFSDTKRHLVLEYIKQKYGEDRVSQLGTVGMYQPRSALNEVGGAFDIPKWETEAVLDTLIKRSSADSRAQDKLEDTINATKEGKQFATKYPFARVAYDMEGRPRYPGKHAAAILLTEKPVRTYVPVDERAGTTMCDKKDAEELDFLKIDALGLTQLSILEEAMEQAGVDRSVLDELEPNDPKAFEVMNDKKFTGIFQFMGAAVKSLATRIKFDRFDDFSALSALGRPGPLATGGADEWIAVRNGLKEPFYPHEVFKPYLEETLGVIIYQEQVMTIGREIGGLSWEDVTALRKAMSKSLGKEYFDQFGDKFKSGAESKGVPRETCEKLWDDMCAYGAWAFNKSHAVAYGRISYWCAWMKAYHPYEFAAATLTHEGDPKRQIEILRELAREDINYTPVDPEISDDKWRVKRKEGKTYLVGPVTAVKGIGPKMASQIISCRQLGAPLPERAQKLLANAVTPVDSLYPVRDAVARNCPPLDEMNILSEPVPLHKIGPDHHNKSFLVIVRIDKIKPNDENEEVYVARRGGKRISGPHTTRLILKISDDTDEIVAKVHRNHYDKLGKPIVELGGAGKVIYALKGQLAYLDGFRLFNIHRIKYLTRLA